MRGILVGHGGGFVGLEMPRQNSAFERLCQKPELVLELVVMPIAILSLIGVNFYVLLCGKYGETITNIFAGFLGAASGYVFRGKR